MEPATYEVIRRITDSFVPEIANDAARQRARCFLNERVIMHPTLGGIDASRVTVWQTPLPRTHGRYLHGFLFFADWHATVLATPGGKETAHQHALNLVLSWATCNTGVPGSSDMAFHDETTAQRSLQMARLLDEFPGGVPEEYVSAVQALVTLHVDLLSAASFYAGNNNHGMFQDIALLRLVTSDVGMAVTDPQHRDDLLHLAADRLHRYFTSSFTRDGVHVENSPGYHLMVSRYLRDLIPVLDLLEPGTSASLHGIYEGAERFATHMIMPNGFLPPLGDTKVARVRDMSHRSTFSSPAYDYAVHQGTRGVAPSETTAVFPDGGYAVHRSSWEVQDADWLVFKSGYRSNYHHHADDLSLLVYTHGHLVLGEAGPFGYDYSDPLTKYAFSQFAHNVITVDGVSQPRADREPGGIEFTDHGSEPTGELLVQGVNRRSDHFCHIRDISTAQLEDAQAPRTAVHVDDQVTTDDGHEHDYVLRWHLGAGTRPVLRGNGLELFVGSRKVLEMTWSGPRPSTTRIRRAGEGPGVHGHRFPTFGKSEPGAVLEIAARGTSFRLTTLICTGDFTLRDWGVGAPGSAWRQFQAEMPVNYLLETHPGARKLVVVFSAMAPVGSFTYNYRDAVSVLDAHTLFVMDDCGDQGAYFFSDHRDESIRRSVLSAVTDVKDRLGVDWSDVAFVGSSKGGTAALIFGGTVPVGRIVVGAPQTRVGSFLKKPHPNVLEYMTGGTDEADIAWADEIVPRQLRGLAPSTSVEVIIGTRDHHYRDHLPLLRRELSAMGHSNLLVREVPGLTHAEIGPPFRQFIRERLGPWAGERNPGAQTAPAAPVVDAMARGACVSASVTGTDLPVSAAYYLYRGKEAIRKTAYTKYAYDIQFDDVPPGLYRVRCFLRTQVTDTPTAVSSPSVRVI